jgi:type II secretory pathway component PulK
MVIIFALASLVLVLGGAMRTEATAAANRLAAQEASAVARGAEQYVLAILSDTTVPAEELDESTFEAVPVGPGPQPGYFWVLRPDYDDASLPVYGVTDESGKLDLNASSFETLRLLPGMTDEIAGAIVDWRDEDDEPSPSGAESQAYLSGDEPYRAKNESFEFVEELGLVSGMTHELLYGQGTDVPVGGAPVGGSGGVLGDGGGFGRSFTSENYQLRGLFNYFTVWSRASNLDPDGGQRVSINGNDQREELRELLRDKLGSRGNEVAGRIPSRDFQNVFDFALALQLDASEFELIEPYISTSGGPQGPRGRINVNAAPREVLLCLEGLTESDVDALIARRAPGASSEPTSMAWVLDVLKERSLEVGSRITGRGNRYSADIVAVSGNGRAFRRVRVVISTVATPPQIVYRRDITDLGWPMDRSILDDLRAGRAPTVTSGSGVSGMRF